MIGTNPNGDAATMATISNNLMDSNNPEEVSRYTATRAANQAIENDLTSQNHIARLAAEFQLPPNDPRVIERYNIERARGIAITDSGVPREGVNLESDANKEKFQDAVDNIVRNPADGIGNDHNLQSGALVSTQTQDGGQITAGNRVDENGNVTDDEQVVNRGDVEGAYRDATARENTQSDIERQIASGQLSWFQLAAIRDQARAAVARGQQDQLAVQQEAQRYLNGEGGYFTNQANRSRELQAAGQTQYRATGNNDSATEVKTIGTNSTPTTALITAGDNYDNSGRRITQQNASEPLSTLIFSELILQVI